MDFEKFMNDPSSMPNFQEFMAMLQSLQPEIKESDVKLDTLSSMPIGEALQAVSNGGVAYYATDVHNHLVTLLPTAYAYASFDAEPGRPGYVIQAVPDGVIFFIRKSISKEYKISPVDMLPDVGVVFNHGVTAPKVPVNLEFNKTQLEKDIASLEASLKVEKEMMETISSHSPDIANDLFNFKDKEATIVAKKAELVAVIEELANEENC